MQTVFSYETHRLSYPDRLCVHLGQTARFARTDPVFSYDDNPV
ncbi:hypothetical protein HMPREF9445_02909 [Bacteroides clarus YIT 12056]|uniref:Uncharacterized protein n=1 Tax=Bacteroides clarus YIT 12056 TaxID=762984 RepID=A0ABP2KMF1_9BACE|nr:hypothetical protein HMPREF9445_02909 [Bacteroides clarus YIT 12056]